MKLLLHACCGPCSLEPSRLLREQGHELEIFYANSNIAPADEYAHRLRTLREWAGSEGFAVHEGVYDPEAWQACAGRIGDAALEEARSHIAEEDFRRIDGPGGGEHPTSGSAAPESCRRDQGGGGYGNGGGTKGSGEHDDGSAGGIEDVRARLSAEERAVLSVDPAKRAARCRACYRLRLEETARRACQQGFDGIATTLSVSPYQYTDIIQEELQRAASKAGIRAVFQDFRPYYPQATRRSRDLGMYRQNYCGCLISRQEAAAERAERKIQRANDRAREKAAHAAERAQKQRELDRRKAERAAYDAKQARKHAVLKALRAQRVQQRNG